MYKRNVQGWLKHIDFILWDILALQMDDEQETILSQMKNNKE